MVSLPSGSKSNLLTPGCGEGTYSIIDGPGQEKGQLVSKRCKLPNDVQGRIFKGKIKGEGCEMRDQLMDFVATGWW